MVKSAKRCIKTVGKSCLTYDELLTVVTEVEAVLNSRPISYVLMDDLEEPLTPSHLLTGFHVLSLPDPPIVEDPDYNESPKALTRRMRHFLITLEILEEMEGRISAGVESSIEFRIQTRTEQ